MAKKPEATLATTIGVLVERVDSFAKRMDEKHTDLKSSIETIRLGITTKVEENSKEITRMENVKANRDEVNRVQSSIDKHFEDLKPILASFMVRSEVEGLFNAVDKRFDEFDLRVKPLEQSWWQNKGIMVSVGVIWPIVVGVAMIWVSHHL